MKKLAVENVGKRLIDFAGNLQVVVFWPADLELVIDAPSLRRRFMDQALSLIDRNYRRTLLEYGKVLTARNRILDRIRDGQGRQSELDFWDNKLVDLGGYITHNREILFLYLNGIEHKLGPISWTYRPSIIDAEKVEKTRPRDIEAGQTLSGPQRDDFIFLWEDRDLSLFGSRGEQRIAVLALKLGELEFLTDRRGERPILILDDIFSELDEDHRKHVLGVVDRQQTIVTTTDIDSIPEKLLKEVKVIQTDKINPA
jgi:DNA replication and repair protein RecF